MSGGGGPQRATAATAVYTFATNLSVAILSLLNVLVVSRVLGPTGRGEFAFLTTIAWLASNVASSGIHEANANIGGQEPAARRALATNSILLSAAFGALAILVLTILIAVFPVVGGHVPAELRWLTLASLPMLILGIYLRMLLQSSYAFRITNSAWLLAPLVNVVGNGIAAAAGWLTVTTALATWVGGQVLCVLVMSWFVAFRREGFGRPNLGLARRCLGFGVRSHPGRIMLLGNYRLDQWILGAIAGQQQLGLYSVAVAWSEALFYLPTSLQLVQRPNLVRASRREAVRQAQTAFRASILLTAALGAGMFIAAPFLCVTIFGSDFHGSITELRILILGAFGIVAMKQLGNALTAQAKPLLASVLTGIGFVAITALDFTLIPGHGGIGASYASTIAYSLGGLAVAAGFVYALGGRATDLVPRPADIGWLWALRHLRRPAAPAQAELS